MHTWWRIYGLGLVLLLLAGCDSLGGGNDYKVVGPDCFSNSGSDTDGGLAGSGSLDGTSTGGSGGAAGARGGSGCTGGSIESSQTTR